MLFAHFHLYQMQNIHRCNYYNQFLNNLVYIYMFHHHYNTYFHRHYYQPLLNLLSYTYILIKEKKHVITIISFEVFLFHFLLLHTGCPKKEVVEKYVSFAHICSKGKVHMIVIIQRLGYIMNTYLYRELHHFHCMMEKIQFDNCCSHFLNILLNNYMTHQPCMMILQCCMYILIRKIAN